MGVLCSAGPASAALPDGYPGVPYAKVQGIPGRVFLSDFDQGPKNVTWHDYESKNPWACHIRDSTGVGLQIMGEGGDAGDTKEADSLVKERTKIKACYLAETNTGDWTKYTVRVAQAGAYDLAFLSAAAQTQIPFVAVSLIQGKDSAGTGQLTLPLTTYFHHWVYTRKVAHMVLDSGLQVLRFDIPGNGPMNIDYIDFTASDASALEAPRDKASGAEGLRRVSWDAGGLQVEYFARAEGPAHIRAFDAQGALVGSLDAGRATLGRNVFRLAPAASAKVAGHAKGLVFVRVDQGGKSVALKAALLRP